MSNPGQFMSNLDRLENGVTVYEGGYPLDMDDPWDSRYYCPSPQPESDIKVDPPADTLHRYTGPTQIDNMRGAADTTEYQLRID